MQRRKAEVTAERTPADVISDYLELQGLSRNGEVIVEWLENCGFAIVSRADLAEDQHRLFLYETKLAEQPPQPWPSVEQFHAPQAQFRRDHDKKAPFAYKGERVTCPNGHLVETFSRDVYQGEVLMANWFEDSQLKQGDIWGKCPTCGVECCAGEHGPGEGGVIDVVRICTKMHIEGQWRDIA